MILPPGAQPIVDLRKRGKRPDEMLIVSLVGPTRDANHSILANPHVDYDWRWSTRLQMCIYADHRTPWSNTAMAIARCWPAWLGLWDVEALQGADLYALPRIEDIDKPRGQWRWRLHAITWLPLQNQEFAWGGV